MFVKNFFKENKILVLLLAFFVLVSGVSIVNRINIENENKTYDIVADYREIELLAMQEHKDPSEILKMFRDELNITKIAILEENLMTLMEDTDVDVSTDVFDVITKEANWKDEYPAEFLNALEENGYDRYDVLVEMGSKEAVDFVINALEKRLEEGSFYTVELGDEAYAVIDGNTKNALYSQTYKYIDSQKKGFTQRTDIEGSKIMYISLGLLPEKIEKVKELGMEVIPRTSSYDGFNGEKFAKAVVEEYNKYDLKPEYMIAGGEAVIGFDDGTDVVEKYLAENDTLIGLIENTTQLQNIMQSGIDKVVKDIDYNTVRLFSVWDYIQNRYEYYGYEGAKEIENTFFRTITERNVRVLYFKPIKEKDDMYAYVTNVEDYKELFTNLNARLEEHGITYGSASVMKSHEVSTMHKLLMSFGTVVATVMLIAAIIPMRKKGKIVLGVLGAVGAAGAAFVVPNTFELILSFASAVVFACLAVTFYTSISKKYREELQPDTSLGKIIGIATATVIVAVLISLIGGIMTAAPLSSTRYMLEIDIFRGVKLAQLIPIAFFAVVYLAYFGFGSTKKNPGMLEVQDIKDMLNTPIKIWMILVGAVVGGVGFYYIMRTGHDSSVQVSTFEMLFRNYLEDSLIARPRTKEFLFAFPAVMMMVYTAIRRFKLWPIMFGLCGVIGMTSVNNTFMHLRTPLYLGFARTGFSLLFGIVVGIVGILAFELLYKVYLKWVAPFIERYSAQE